MHPMDNNPIDKLFRERLSDAAETPPAQVWQGVNQAVSKKGKSGWIWYALPVLFAAITIGYFAIDFNSSNTIIVSQTNKLDNKQTTLANQNIESNPGNKQENKPADTQQKTEYPTEIHQMTGETNEKKNHQANHEKAVQKSANAKKTNVSKNSLTNSGSYTNSQETALQTGNTSSLKQSNSGSPVQKSTDNKTNTSQQPSAISNPNENKSTASVTENNTLANNNTKDSSFDKKGAESNSLSEQLATETQEKTRRTENNTTANPEKQYRKPTNILENQYPVIGCYPLENQLTFNTLALDSSYFNEKKNRNLLQSLHIGVYGGPAIYGNLYSKSADAGKVDSYRNNLNSKPAFTTGLQLRYTLKPSVTVSAGIEYSSRKAIQNYEKTITSSYNTLDSIGFFQDSIGNVYVIYDTVTHYSTSKTPANEQQLVSMLSIPVLAGWQFTYNRLSIGVEAGILLHVMRKYQGDVYSTGTSVTDGGVLMSAYYNQYKADAQVSLRTAYQLTHRWQIAGSLFGRLSLASTTGPIQHRISAFGLQAGIFYTMGTK
jgi:hypothetical protein